MLSLIIGKLVQTGLLRFQKAMGPGWSKCGPERALHHVPRRAHPSAGQRREAVAGHARAATAEPDVPDPDTINFASFSTGEGMLSKNIWESAL